MSVCTEEKIEGTGRSETLKVLCRPTPDKCFYVKRLISTMQTNPDSRYEEQQGKNIETRLASNSISYLQSRCKEMSENLQEEDRNADITRNEPLFTEAASAFCWAVLQHRRSAIQPQHFRVGAWASASGVDIQLGSPQTLGSSAATLRGSFVLPPFFPGPLSEAEKLTERCHGKAWPVLLFFLYHTRSRKNYRFLSEVLCPVQKKATLRLSKSRPRGSQHQNQPMELRAGVKKNPNSSNGNEYSTNYSGVRELLLERGAKFIPWDCTSSESRAALASAFMGTRLEQWLQTCNKSNSYPLLAAIGRRQSGDVVCSLLKGYSTNLKDALKWIDSVLKAHFQDFTNCPNEGDLKKENIGEDVKETNHFSSNTGDVTTNLANCKEEANVETKVIFESYVEDTTEKDSPCIDEKPKGVEREYSRSRFESDAESVPEEMQTTCLRRQLRVVRPSEDLLRMNRGKPPIPKYRRSLSNSAQTLHSARGGVSNGESVLRFMKEFTDTYVSGLPVMPNFLLSRFSTAVEKCLHIENDIALQIQPLLVYLHDEESSKTMHFVANVLCSRRFSTFLYDRGLTIWPINLSGANKCTHKERRIFSLSRKVSRSARPSNQSERVLKAAAAPKVLSTAGFNGDERFRANAGLPHLAKAFLQLLSGQPAELTIQQLMMKPGLPVIINMQIVERKFIVQSYIPPAVTTKEAVSWISNTIKSFEDASDYQS